MRSTDQIENREAHPTGGEKSGKVSERGLAGSARERESFRGLNALRRRLRISFSFLTMLTMLLITLEFMMSHRNVADPDIWWHLRNAEYLFQHHQLPHFDLYSFTVPGHAWINHEWLAEIPYYLAWRTGGLSGLNAVLLVVIELIFLGLLYLCYQESGNFKASVAACCFSTFLATVSFGPRTILFGYAYLVVLLIILQHFRHKGRAPLWLIPPLFCLWVNTHGSWLLGLVIFSIIAAAGLIKGTWGRVEAEPWTPSQLRKLAVTWVMSVAALFVNPFGHRLVLYPFDLAFRQRLNIAHIEEWTSVNFHEARGRLVLILLVTLFLSALLRSRRWNLAELGLVLFALYSGLTHIRFLFLLGILVAPVMAKILDFVPPYRAEIDTPLINALAMFLMVAGMVHYWPTSAKLQDLVDQQYPAAVLPYLRAHPSAGPMLNFYLWGGYLGWNDRNVKVFVDSRVDIFEYAGVFKDYIDLLGLKEPKSILDKYKIRYVLFPHGEPLTYVLEHDPGWKVLYNDRISVLLERASEDSTGPAEKVTARHP
jgi:hypothetical protein